MCVRSRCQSGVLLLVVCFCVFVFVILSGCLDTKVSDLLYPPSFLVQSIFPYHTILAMTKLDLAAAKKHEFDPWEPLGRRGLTSVGCPLASIHAG